MQGAALCPVTTSIMSGQKANPDQIRLVLTIHVALGLPLLAGILCFLIASEDRAAQLRAWEAFGVTAAISAVVITAGAHLTGAFPVRNRRAFVTGALWIAGIFAAQAVGALRHQKLPVLFGFLIGSFAVIGFGIIRRLYRPDWLSDFGARRGRDR